MRKHAPTAALVLAILCLAGALAYTTLRGRGEDELPEMPDPPKIGALEARLPEARADAERAVRDYKPAGPGPITDPGSPAAEILRGLPSVARVEVRVPCARPARRIIHGRDWHAVPLDLVVAENPGLSEEQVDVRYQELLL